MWKKWVETTISMQSEYVSKPLKEIKFTPGNVSKSHHLPNGRFTNPWISAGKPIGFLSFFRNFKDFNWKNMRTVPPIEERVPVDNVDFSLLSKIHTNEVKEYSVTWLGHSSFLIIWNGVKIITDPVFSQRCSPFSFMGPKRFTQPPCNIADLLPIDLVLISHCHYDHLDRETIKQIGNKAHYIAPLKTGYLLKKFGILNGNISEMDWHDEIEIGFGSQHGYDRNLKINCTPAQHGANRWIWDRDAYLWCSYIIQDSKAKLFFAGDTGYRKVPRGVVGDAVLDYPHNPSFKEIGEKFKEIDVALIPIGAYSPKHVFSLVHADPFDAACIFRDIRAKRFHPMHYGTFTLTDEPHNEPPVKALEALTRLGISPDVFVAQHIGQTVRYKFGNK
eukprot:NODE_731_length_4728_cov_0.293368.p2 type:complete len:389 gc:universal NODE_731_length_4728_cov_0.293368:4439-3273(-)